jgi:DNA-binding beta-propeller fold protein YncE
VRIWNVATRTQSLELAGPGGDVLGIAIASDGTRAVVTGGGVGAYPLEDPAATVTIDAGESLSIAGYTRAGDRLYLTSDTAVEMRDARSGERLSRIVTGPADGSTIDPDGTFVAVPLADAPATELRDLRTGTARARLATADPQYAAIVDHAGRHVATVGDNGAVDLWDTSGRHLSTLRGHDGAVFSAAFDAGDRRLATVGYADHTVRIWDVATGRQLGQLSTDDGPFTAAFDPDGDRLLTSTDDSRAELWDLRTFSLIRTFEHPSAIRSAVFRPDGRLIATAARNGTVAVWDVATGEEVARFHHALFALYVVFSPDGQRLLSTSTDHLAIQWDVTATVPTPADVDTFARCHVPFVLEGTALQRVPRAACM